MKRALTDSEIAVEPQNSQRSLPVWRLQLHALVRPKLLALFMLLAAPLVARAGEDPATCCPGYPAHLRAARVALVRGDRDAALSELREAQAALASCLREEAAGRSLLARRVTLLQHG